MTIRAPPFMYIYIYIYTVFFNIQQFGILNTVFIYLYPTLTIRTYDFPKHFIVTDFKI